MYLLVIFFPIISAFILGFFGRFIGRKGAAILSTTCIFLAFVTSLIIFYEVALLNSVCLIKLTPWFDIGLLNVQWGFLFDSLTAMMLIIVTLISCLVHLYSISYMEHDPHLIRFMSYLSLFTMFMLFLVTADNFIQMFLGWEGVGLASYLLINFWFTRLQANKAALKALIVNRIGDLGLIVGLSLIYSLFKSLNYFVVFPLSFLHINSTFLFLNFEVNALNIICLFIFIGAVGKSAQIGLHTWLPDAMEGPTPVSALIHAATMVTAGVFIIIRCSHLFEYAPSILWFITLVGALTAFFAATTGMFQNDLKKVIAYSTCSQLGYMIFACGLSNYSVSIFHLTNHAYFKALLFLSAGVVIHALSDEQDMRKMGGLVNILPFTYIMVVIGSLSLMGFPFLTGFYSKDIILELSYAKFTLIGNFAYWLGLISAFFTSFYSIRLLYLTFYTKPTGFKKVLETAHEPSLLMSIPLFILSLGSIFIGYIMKDMCLGLGTDFWGTAIFNLDNNITVLSGEFMPFHIKLLPLYFSSLGAFLVYYNNYLFINYNYYNIILSYKNIYNFLIKKWYFDIIYNKFIVYNTLSIGFFTFKDIDRGIIEIVGPLGLVRFINNFISKVNKLQTSYVYNYVFLFVIGLTLSITFISLIYFLPITFLDSRLYICILLILIFLLNS